MRAVRVILASCFIMISVFLSGDLYYRQTSVLDDFIVTDKEESDFYVAKKYYGDYREDIMIFCDDNIRSRMENNYDLYEGRYNSIISGKFNIKYMPFSSLDVSTVSKNPDGYSVYFDGAIRNRRIKVFYCVLFAFIFLYIVLITYYDISNIKNEIFVRLSLGNFVSMELFLKATVHDLVYIISYAVSVILKRTIFCTSFLDRYSLIFMILICVTEYILYGSILSSDIRSGLSKLKFSDRLLSVMYFIKVLQMVALCIVLIITARSLEKHQELSKQKMFYEDLKEYDMVVIRPLDINNMFNAAYNAALEGLFYEQFYEDFDIRLFQEAVKYGDDFSEVAYNTNMREYLLLNFPSMKEAFEKYDAIVLLPENKNIGAEEELNARKDASKMSDIPYYEVPVYKYKGSRSLIVKSEGDLYAIINNPVIVYGGKYDNAMYLQSCVLKTDDEKINYFCEKHNCVVSVSSVYEDFLHRINNTKKILFLNICLLAILVLLSVSMSVTLIQAEFDMNRMEIIIKKTMGETLPKQLLKPAYPSFISAFLGLLISVFICRYFSEDSLAVMFTPSLILTISDAFIITIYALKFSNESIVKLLKGIL